MSKRPRAVRVCLVGDGKSVHLRRWAVDLGAAGADVSVLSYRQSSPLEGVPWQVASLGPPVIRQALGWLRTRRFLQRTRPDVVHLHFLPYGPRGLWALGARAALVANPYGTDVEAPPPGWRGRVGRRVVRAALRRADAVVTASEHLMRLTLELGAVRPDARREVIGFGVDCERFAPRPRSVAEPDAPVVIGFAKGLYDYYGFMDLLDAVATLRADPSVPEIRVRAAGDGPLATRVRARVDELGLGGVVELLGTLPDAELPEFYGSLDVFAMPSHREAYGVAALEASAMEVPVVATSVGGVPEVVADGQTGLLVPAADPAALARALRQLVADPPLRRRLGAAGRTRACRDHGRAASVRRVLELYETLLTARTE